MIDSNEFYFDSELNDDSSELCYGNQVSFPDSFFDIPAEDLIHNVMSESETDSPVTQDILEGTGSIHNSVHDFVSSPYDSGFDDEYPIPSYKELRNAGFTDFEAKKIIYGDHEMYSDKELYECLYESDDPKASYDAMIKEKTDEMFRKIDERIARL